MFVAASGRMTGEGRMTKSDSSSDVLKWRWKAPMSTLPLRKQEVLSMRFGHQDDALTVNEVSLYFNCPESTIRRMENRALRRLRHPTIAHTQENGDTTAALDAFRQEKGAIMPPS